MNKLIPEDAITFLQDLIQTDSVNPPGNEARVAEKIASRLAHRVSVERVSLTEGRENLLVRLGKGERTLLFCGHMDTVSLGDPEGWSVPPLAGKIMDNRIYGRGASDMKSGLAAMVLALESLVLEGVEPGGEILLLATAGEEVDSCGARNYYEQGGMEEVDGMVIGEPTGEKVAVGHKGALWLEVTTQGRTAHGSMPGKGINAVSHLLHMAGLLEEMELGWRYEDEILGGESVALTQIQGGIQTNVIPDRARFTADIRTVPPREHGTLVREVEERLHEGRRKYPDLSFQVRILLDRPAILTPPKDPLIRLALELKGDPERKVVGVPYYTDGSVLNADSLVPTLIYGPGEEALAHQPDEWVDIDAYLRSITFYRELALRFFRIC
ncbi:succinyl-diaminopimelate desuccinylase [Marininema mesophilum]|uniref:Probable succinyl-diaminopimelate desuccinylase n=1 Tax=Marininema mesophilum TaxID=1048340 RepID=A0A1H2QSF5_9BACL|nr:M20 family metallopeptidase [Marininema mesophilum]SDW10071.1 succinyl-diaminopimelate desuccinylase [Marininema mesophilum]